MVRVFSRDMLTVLLLLLLLLYLNSPSGKGILSGHADGAVVRFFFDDEGSGDSQVRFR